jgi:tRNA pseudouridine38-40 synthase
LHSGFRILLSPMPRYALLIAYDGTGFAGWWRQPGLRTVAGEFDAALARLGESSASPVGASRTDAGVHARGQVAHVDLSRIWETSTLQRTLAAQLPADCALRAVAPVGDDWHAVHGASGKTYSYSIDNGAIGDPFRTRHAWRPPFRLDLATLNGLAALIPGRRDWRGFARRGDHREAEDFVRTITAVGWRADGDLLVCTVSGDGFVYRLVRSLVGALVATAHGGCSRADLDAALAGQESPAGHQQAPAHGLCLERVTYPQEPFVVR